MEQSPIVFVTPDGKENMPGLIYDPEKHASKEINNP